MTQQEVAIALNLPLKTVKNIEFKALRKLKQKFLELGSEDVWFDILFNIREKDPCEYYYDNNLCL